MGLERTDRLEPWGSALLERTLQGTRGHSTRRMGARWRIECNSGSCILLVQGYVGHGETLTTFRGCTVKVPSVSLELVISDAMHVQPSGTNGAIAWQLPTVWQALRSDFAQPGEQTRDPREDPARLPFPDLLFAPRPLPS